MQNWKATTESGTTYTFDGWSVLIESNRHGTYRIRPWVMRVSTEPADGPNKIGMPWTDPDHWEDSPVPVVGQHLYVAGKDEWRISTLIETVELLPDAEEERTAA